MLPWLSENIEICIILLVIAYLIQIFTRNHIANDRKAKWAALLLIGSAITIPIYWYQYIWQEPQSLSAEPTRIDGGTRGTCVFILVALLLGAFFWGSNLLLITAMADFFYTPDPRTPMGMQIFLLCLSLLPFPSIVGIAILFLKRTRDIHPKTIMYSVLGITVTAGFFLYRLGYWITTIGS
jgi:hypothetical protein